MHKNPGGNRNSGLWYETFGHPLRPRSPQDLNVRAGREAARRGSRRSESAPHGPRPRVTYYIVMSLFPVVPQGFVRPECRSVFRLLSCLHVSPAVLPHGIRTRVSAAAQSSSGHGHGRPVSRNVGRMPPTLRRYLPSSFESRSTTSGCSSATSCFSEMSFGMSNSSLRPVS